MKNAVYVVGFLTFFILGIGIMFEFFQWPFSGKLMMLGFVLLNFAFLPTFFYKLYKMQKVA